MVIFAREKKKLPVKNFNFVPVKIDFVPVKKTKKVPVKKKVGVKKVKNGPKSGREKGKVPVKKTEKRPKNVFTGTFYFHGEKNTGQD